MTWRNCLTSSPINSTTAFATGLGLLAISSFPSDFSATKVAEWDFFVIPSPRFFGIS
ncbi:Uncharacterised protein [Vibrio cholerae]|nr:Uncharacterised protein [Vibrio cholerae]